MLKKEILPYCPAPVIVLDTQGEYTGGVIYPGSGSFARSVLFGMPNKTGLYIIRPENKRESEHLFNICTKIEGSFTLIVEEAHRYCSPHEINERLEELLKQGAHYGANLILVTQRAAGIHKDVTSQSSCIITFQQTDQNDVNRLSVISEKAKLVPSLNYDEHEFLIIGDCPESLSHLESLER